MMIAVLYFFVWRLLNLLTKQNARLSELNDLKNKFLGIAAHDLRNPLGVLMGYIKLFRYNFLGELTREKDEILKYMNNGTEKMLGLVNELLDLTVNNLGR